MARLERSVIEFKEATPRDRAVPPKASAVFRIKICGVTRPDDAALVSEAGADAIGLNFYPGSRRAIDLARAREVIAELDDQVVRVGLFVNATSDAIRQAHGELGLGLVQLHGDETPEQLAELSDLPVMRALRCGPNCMQEVGDYLQRCRGLGCSPQMVLLDAFQPGTYGGTGRTADWSQIAAQREVLGSVPLVLAGGLTSDNVAEAISTVRPQAVDTSSGVESKPGQKDRRHVFDFVQAAQAAFDRLEPS